MNLTPLLSSNISTIDCIVYMLVIGVVAFIFEILWCCEEIKRKKLKVELEYYKSLCQNQNNNLISPKNKIINANANKALFPTCSKTHNPANPETAITNIEKTIFNKSLVFIRSLWHNFPAMFAAALHIGAGLVSILLGYLSKINTGITSAITRTRPTFFQNHKFIGFRKRAIIHKTSSHNTKSTKPEKGSQHEPSSTSLRKVYSARDNSNLTLAG